MKVDCDSFISFSANLLLPEKKKLFDDTIWWDTFYRKIEGTDSKEVVCQASCVIVTEDGEYIVQMAVDCGIDRTSEPVSNEGTETKDTHFGLLKSLCEENGFKINYGVLTA